MYYNAGDYETFQILQALMPIITIYFVTMAVVALAGLASYLLRGIAINKLSARRGIPNGWLGFIPVAHNYQLGKIAGEIEFGRKKIKNTGLWLILAPIIYGLLTFIGILIVMIPYIFKISALVEYATDALIIEAVTTLIVSCIVLALVLLVAQVFLYLFKYLALHKIFAQHSIGQRPVFYMIIAMFVPLAEPILLLMHSNRPLLETDTAEQTAPPETTVAEPVIENNNTAE